MEFRLLGPVEASDGETLLPLGGGKQRALLALLLLNANRVVAVERIVDALWGESLPDTAVKGVQIYVSRLRKVLPRGRLETKPPGYVIRVERDELDLQRVEALLHSGLEALASSRPDEASVALATALELWRGPALAEFDEPFAAGESARLEELRLTCLEERIEADLALGRQARLAGELEALVARHRLRERLRAQQMLALYRCDRQAEALAAYQEFRALLDEELGIEPSPRLRELERRILRQAPELDLVPAEAAARTSPASAEPAGPAMPVNALAALSPREPGPIRYARSGELSIAYQVTGSGPVDVVLVPGFVSHLEKDWEEPRHARFLERLGGFARLIRFDKRGTGLSDRPFGLPDLEARMDDVRAVMDAVDSRRAVLFGYSEGGPMSVLFAASHPERVSALVLYGTYAKRTGPAEDYPWAESPEVRAALIESLFREWGFESHMKRLAPSADPAMASWWNERCRAAASPGALRALLEMNSQIDVRHVLAAIHVPTLVVHRTGDARVRVEEGRYIAERISGARFVELPGVDHFVAIDPDQILAVVEPFVRALPAEDDSRGDRVLATIVISDIVGSTELVAKVGDRAWAELRARHDSVVAAELERFSGELLDSAGDGVLAVFDGPTRAIRCARAMSEGLRGLGLRTRIGLHTGEVERRPEGVRGIAVHLASRVAGEASADEVLVTATTRDLVAGSGIEFADRGERELKGIDEPRRLFAVMRV